MKDVFVPQEIKRADTEAVTGALQMAFVSVPARAIESKVNVLDERLSLIVGVIDTAVPVNIEVVTISLFPTTADCVKVDPRAAVDDPKSQEHIFIAGVAISPLPRRGHFRGIYHKSSFTISKVYHCVL